MEPAESYYDTIRDIITHIVDASGGVIEYTSLWGQLRATLEGVQVSPGDVVARTLSATVVPLPDAPGFVTLRCSSEPDEDSVILGIQQEILEILLERQEETLETLRSMVVWGSLRPYVRSHQLEMAIDGLIEMGLVAKGTHRVPTLQLM